MNVDANPPPGPDPDAEIDPAPEPMPAREGPPLEVYLLGTIDFDEAQQFQRRLVYDLGDAEQGAGGALILCEHPPTISVGRLGSRAHILPDDAELRAQGLRVRWVNRGGGCVLHLPGQLVGYLVLPLERAGQTVQGFVDGIHRVLLGVLSEFDLAGTLGPDPAEPGVFLGGSRVASVGVAVNRWIGYHGFTLNVATFLEPFDLIDDAPPGSKRSRERGPTRQTSMESWRQRPAPMPRVREAVIRHVEEVFGLARHHVYTDHPTLRAKAGPHVYAQSG